MLYGSETVDAFDEEVLIENGLLLLDVLARIDKGGVV
jgi:hypothetical protein